jgi:hypothetical protein
VAEAVADYASRLSALPGVARVDTVSGEYAAGRLLTSAPGSASTYVGTHGGAWISLWQSGAEPASARAQHLVALVRAVPAPFPVLVGGLAAHFHDTKQTVLRSLPGALAVVFLATFVLLFLFTGSVVLPLKAIALNTLNLAAVLGSLVFIFQEGHLQWLVGNFQVTHTLELTTPVLMFCVAFGLSMDYEIFLLARIREEYEDTRDNSAAVVRGLGATGPLLTYVAFAMIIVMIAVATSQISLVKMVGTGLALAVALDVTVVRGILVPAFMALAGDYNWWAPRPLVLLHRRFGLREGTRAASDQRIWRTAITVPIRIQRDRQHPDYLAYYHRDAEPVPAGRQVVFAPARGSLYDGPLYDGPLYDGPPPVYENPAHDTRVYETPPPLHEDPVQLYPRMYENPPRVYEGPARSYEPPPPLYEDPMQVYPARVRENPPQVYDNPARVVYEPPAPLYEAPGRVVYEAAPPFYDDPIQVYPARVSENPPRVVYETPIPLYEGPAGIYQAPPPLYEDPIRVYEDPER